MLNRDLHAGALAEADDDDLDWVPAKVRKQRALERHMQRVQADAAGTSAAAEVSKRVAQRAVRIGAQAGIKVEAEKLIPKEGTLPLVTLRGCGGFVVAIVIVGIAAHKWRDRLGHSHLPRPVPPPHLFAHPQSLTHPQTVSAVASGGHDARDAGASEEVAAGRGD